MPITNARALVPLRDAMRGRRGRFLFVGYGWDSNGVRNSGSSKYGWMWHLGEAIEARGIAHCCTPLIGPGINDGSSLDPCGYKCAGSATTPNLAALETDYPALANYIPNSANLTIAQPAYIGSNTTGSTWGMRIEADHPIDVSTWLTASLRYYTFGAGSGAHTWSVRNDSAAPNFYTDIATAIALTNNAAAGTTRSDMSINAGVRTQPLRLMPFKNGVAVTAPAGVLWGFIQRLPSVAPQGGGVAAWFSKGGLGMYEMVEALINEPTQLIDAWLTDLLFIVGADGVICNLWMSGVNDLGDSALTSWTSAAAGVPTGFACNTAAGYVGNFRVGRHVLNTRWAAIGGNPANFLHLVIPSHRLRIDPERTELTEYRAAASEFALSTTDTATADFARNQFATGAEMLATGWETPGDGSAAGGDGGRSHLLQSGVGGYSTSAARLLDMIDRYAVDGKRSRDGGRSRLR